jgi:hypothetical protein
MSTHQKNGFSAIHYQFISLPKLTSIIGFFLTSLYCWHIFRTYWRLKHVPGPLWAKFSDLHRVWIVKTMNSHEIHQHYHLRYGDLVRLGPNMVTISDPAAIPTVYPMRPGCPKVRTTDLRYNKSKTYKRKGERRINKNELESY